MEFLLNSFYRSCCNLLICYHRRQHLHFVLHSFFISNTENITNFMNAINIFSNFLMLFGDTRTITSEYVRLRLKNSTCCKSMADFSLAAYKAAFTIHQSQIRTCRLSYISRFFEKNRQAALSSFYIMKTFTSFAICALY